jgi:hypothetical protein
VTGLPPRRAATRVEPGLVGDEAPGGAADAGRAHAPGQIGEAGTVEGRVAVAPEDEIPAPDRPVRPAFAQHLRARPERGAERDERRVGEYELLVGGGQERRVRIPGIDRLAGAEVDGQHGRATSVEARMRGVQPVAKRRRRGRCEDDGEHESAHASDDEGGPHQRER